MLKLIKKKFLFMSFQSLTQRLLSENTENELETSSAIMPGDILPVPTTLSECMAFSDFGKIMLSIMNEFEAIEICVAEEKQKKFGGSLEITTSTTTPTPIKRRPTTTTTTTTTETPDEDEGEDENDEEIFDTNQKNEEEGADDGGFDIEEL